MARRKSTSMALWGFRLVLAAAIAVGIGYLPYKAYGPEGIGKVAQLEREHVSLDKEVSRLTSENKELNVEIRALKRSRRAAERVARDELGLVRPSDLVFIFE